MKTMTLFLILVFTVCCGKSPFTETLQAKEKEVQIKKSENTLVLSKSNFELTPFWRDSPEVSQGSRMLVVSTNGLGQPRDLPHKFGALLWMPGMGHESSPITIKHIGEGLYELSNIYFIMGGHWELHFQLLDAENQQLIEEVKWDLNI